jgi:hypothetical protein
MIAFECQGFCCLFYIVAGAVGECAHTAKSEMVYRKELLSALVVCVIHQRVLALGSHCSYHAGNVSLLPGIFAVCDRACCGHCQAVRGLPVYSGSSCTRSYVEDELTATYSILGSTNILHISRASEFIFRPSHLTPSQEVAAESIARNTEAGPFSSIYHDSSWTLTSLFFFPDSDTK